MPRSREAAKPLKSRRTHSYNGDGDIELDVMTAPAGRCAWIDVVGVIEVITQLPIGATTFVLFRRPVCMICCHAQTSRAVPVLLCPADIVRSAAAQWTTHTQLSFHRDHAVTVHNFTKSSSQYEVLGYCSLVRLREDCFLQ